MSELILTTYDWVPELPRGLVRDLRVRWALEEAGLAYRVVSTPFRDRGPDHFAAQPFGQVPLPSQPWVLFRFMGFPGESPEAGFVDGFLKARLDRMETVLAGREWLAGGRFSVADLLMADVLRPLDRFDGLANYPACRAYVARLTSRPAFTKAYDDQMAHFAAADAA